MTFKEALEKLYDRANHDEYIQRKNTEQSLAFLEDNALFKELIKQALERLEVLEKENKELTMQKNATIELIEISNLESHLHYLLERYTDCESKPNGHSYLKKYKTDYDKALLVFKKINEMSSKIKNKGSFGLTFFVPIKTLEEYFELYKLLELIPESEIKIYNPSSISIWEKTYDFCQVE